MKMSHFYGTLQGDRGQATRCGTKSSGMETWCASWKGAIRCYAYEEDGEDWVRVEKRLWSGNGEFKVLYDGPIGKKNDENNFGICETCGQMNLTCEEKDNGENICKECR